MATWANRLGRNSCDAADPLGSRRPNILFIMADDRGKEWISCYGAEDIQTPNIDRLAATAADANGLTDEEVQQGFVSLFDGVSFDGWKHGGNWEIQEGAFVRVRKGRSLTYVAQKVPDDFELRFEWKVSKGCNSGIYYRPGQVGGTGGSASILKWLMITQGPVF